MKLGILLTTLFLAAVFCQIGADDGKDKSNSKTSICSDNYFMLCIKSGCCTATELAVGQKAKRYCTMKAGCKFQLTDDIFKTALSDWKDGGAGKTLVEENYGTISEWDISQVTSIRGAFQWWDTFNEDISSWNVKRVTDMAFAFHSASMFNANISHWRVSEITSLKNTFDSAANFNADISSWDVQKVTDLHYTFQNAGAFNVDIGDWDVRSVTSMYAAFANTGSFSRDLSRWNVTKVSNHGIVFQNSKMAQDPDYHPIFSP